MSVKKYVLDGRAVLSLSDFYNELARVLPLPGYFGHNLDALADTLLTDVKGPLEIVWEYSSASSKAMKEDYPRISAVLKHIARERPDCKITFR
jgi:ribonuclease inhibitor